MASLLGVLHHPRNKGVRREVMDRIIRHFAAPKHMIGKAFVGIVGTSRSRYMTLAVGKPFFRTKDLKKHSLEPDYPRLLLFEIADVRSQSAMVHKFISAET